MVGRRTAPYIAGEVVVFQGLYELDTFTLDLQHIYHTMRLTQHFRRQAQLIKSKRKSNLPMQDSPPKELEDLTMDEIERRIATHIPGWEQGSEPTPWPGQETLTTLMNEVGFVVVRYATGEPLQRMQDQVTRWWQEGTKGTIANQMEHATRKEGKQGYTEWRAFAEDIGRLQVHMPEDIVLPGEDLINCVYPRPTGAAAATWEPVTIMRAILANHPLVGAQHIHWDQPPTKGLSEATRIEKQPGSAILALYPTEVYIYPCSNRFDDSKRCIPVALVIPEGCILMFTTMAHAGYGVWHEGQSIHRPVPSADDFKATNTLEWQPRIHFHIKRGSKTTADPRMAAPDEAIRRGQRFDQSPADRPLEPSSKTTPSSALTSRAKIFH